MERMFHSVEEYSMIRNIVVLAGLVYLLKIAIWVILSLWSGTKSFILSDLFRVKLKPSSYQWAGKDCIFHYL